MEKNLEKALLSILNQSFNDIEIIIVNDNSKDDTVKIIQRFQKEFKNIKIIMHLENRGVYKSRIDAVLNAYGQYILFMDPDDMFLNPYLFEELYNYNIKYNLDMIEFSVFHIKEGTKKFYFPEYHELNHYHNFRKKIICQPELSNILFYKPNTNNYTSLFCRTIWNKLTRKILLINSIKYIEKSFHNFYLITADDTPINILNFQLSNNYSNIKLPGYLYYVREKSSSRLSNDLNHNVLISYNYLLYFKLFYKYLKDFKKNLNFLFYDLKISFQFLFILKKLKAKNYLSTSIIFLKEISKNKISIDFKIFIDKIIYELEKKI